MRIVARVSNQPIKRIGLDMEALPFVSWNGPPTHRHAIAIAWGTEKDVRYIESIDRRPGRFTKPQLAKVRMDLSQPDVVVVGHNALRYDLPLLNGLLISHGLEPLPTLRCQDTMNTLKTGTAYRNTLKAQCERYGVNLKQGGPDWDRVLQGYPDEWALMRAYNCNDVVSTLQLEVALREAGIPCPIKTWKSRKG